MMKTIKLSELITNFRRDEENSLLIHIAPNVYIEKYKAHDGYSGDLLVADCGCEIHHQIWILFGDQEVFNCKGEDIEPTFESICFKQQRENIACKDNRRFYCPFCQHSLDAIKKCCLNCTTRFGKTPSNFEYKQVKNIENVET